MTFFACAFLVCSGPRPSSLFVLQISIRLVICKKAAHRFASIWRVYMSYWVSTLETSSQSRSIAVAALHVYCVVVIIVDCARFFRTKIVKTELNTPPLRIQYSKPNTNKLSRAIISSRPNTYLFNSVKYYLCTHKNTTRPSYTKFCFFFLFSFVQSLNGWIEPYHTCNALIKYSVVFVWKRSIFFLRI